MALADQTQVPGTTRRVFDALLFMGGSPVETLRWAHHRSQQKHVSAFCRALREIFPGIAGSSISLTDVDGLAGEVFERDLLYLCLIAKHLQATRILEIGTLYGRTSLNLAMNTAADAKIWTVDLGADDTGIGKMQADVGMKFRNTPFAGKITQIIHDSRTLDLRPFCPLDFVFIDGDHRYQTVKQDTLKCLPAIRRGGVLAWHDYGLSEDVTAWLDELRATAGLEIWCLPDSCVAVHRRP
jgi:hypothetical protein